MTHVPSPDTFLTPAPDVVARQLPDGAVLVNLSSNRIFELNPTGSRIWALICDGRPIGAIAAALVDEFETTIETAQRDVGSLTERLKAEGLVRP